MLPRPAVNHSQKMPNWNEILDEVKSAGSTYDIVRKKYLANLHQLTKRNVIAYYSGWLQKKGNLPFGIDDSDKIGFMTTIHGLDRTKGLDLILHTPGGDMAATESIVDYLHQMFQMDIRAIVPQLSMSGGTMIACACKSIIMGKHSNLGPIDPQIGGLPAHGIIEEFENAHRETKADPTKIEIWRPILSKYPPTIIGECQKAIKWAEAMVSLWLADGMLKDVPDKSQKIENILEELGNHSLTKSHARHLSALKCRDMGLKIEMMEDDQKLQDAILTLHHIYMITLSATYAVKMIENHGGIAYIPQTT